MGTTKTDELMKELLELLEQNSRKYHPTMTFQDWIEMACLSLRNAMHFDRTREDRYLAIAAKYDKEELINFARCTALLALLFEEEINDWLGEIYMKSGAGNAKAGQFFTPFNLSCLTANLMGNPDGEKEMLCEPSCGSGGLILARAKALKDKGFNYQEILDVTAVDVDKNVSNMCFLQLSIAGIKAKVVHGNTLSLEEWETSYTPMYLMKGCRF